MNIEALLERLGHAGVSTLIKVDELRMKEGGDAWTISMIGPALPEGDFIRIDGPSLQHCFSVGFAQLREYPGDWEWLPQLDS
ncbi:hypothetical protein ACFY2H_40545 [Streptomyces griseofuscus]|uniref:hypothetical protein n=1 Tax=Streptomyces griseofuscus TaxID=146922 RepID=UPI0036B9CB21